MVTSRYNETYSYNDTADTWALVTDIDTASRESAIAFTIGNKAYFGTGYDDGGSGLSRLGDLWEFNPITKNWTEKAPFAGSGRNNAIGISLGGKGIVGGGNGFLSGNSDFFQYNSSSNSWTQIASYPEKEPIGLVGFTIGNTAYIGTGTTGEGFFSSQSKKFYKLQ